MIPDAPATTPTDPHALIGAQMAMLTRLAEVGMAVAEACGREAAGAAEGGGSATGAGLAFARAARAVRMTIALQSSLAKDLAALDRNEEGAEADRKLERRMRLSDLVGQAVEASVDAQRRAGVRRWSDEGVIEEEVERLAEEAYERLTEAEDGWLDGLTFDQAVARICGDLGLSPEWTARVTAATRPPRGGSAERLACPPPDLLAPAAAWTPPPRPPAGASP